MKTKHVLILGLAGVAIFYLLQQVKEFDISSYLDKIDALEQKVDSLHSENETLSIEVGRMEDQLSKYDKEVDSLENRIVIIKKRTDEKLRSIDTLSINQLQRFFTDRYNSSEIKGANSQTSSKGPDNR